MKAKPTTEEIFAYEKLAGLDFFLK